MKRKICIITGTRAEYGLLKPLIDELRSDNSFTVQIIVTGMHLSPEFGLTYKAIEKDSIKIKEKIEILLSSDSPIGVCKAIGLGIISFSEAYNRLKPDLVLGLGDRFELFSAVLPAMISSIPIAHIHGGELTEGAYDNNIRHAITKMSNLHFTSTKVYRNRVIQMGENPETVYNVGALGLDNIKKIKLLSKQRLEQQLNFSLESPYFVVTYHPATLYKNSSEKQVKELLNALEVYSKFRVIFTFANADDGGRIINKLINEFVSNNKEKAVAYSSLGRLKYLSLLKYSNMMIGNSSSGIFEMPFFMKPTVNIGNRQKGRIFSDSIISCKPEKKSIVSAIKKGLESEFLVKCGAIPKIYGDGTTSIKIKKILQKIDFESILKKFFYDLHQIQ